MSSETPQRYRPSNRLIDTPRELRRLYVEEDYTVREIAATHATVSSTRVYEALVEYEIITNNETTDDECSRDSPVVDWSQINRE